VLHRAVYQFWIYIGRIHDWKSFFWSQNPHKKENTGCRKHEHHYKKESVFFEEL